MVTECVANHIQDCTNNKHNVNHGMKSEVMASVHQSIKYTMCEYVV